jgi:hypothetical protein
MSKSHKKQDVKNASSGNPSSGMPEKVPGGLSSGKSPKDFDQQKLADGIKVEMEHTTDKDIAQEIAMDHLSEDPDYYKKLKAIEAKKSEPLSKPYASEAQRRWAHTPAGKEALGGEKAVAHWNKESKGKKLPERVEKSETAPSEAPSQEDLSQQYEKLLHNHYPKDFVDTVIRGDKASAQFLGGPISHEKHGNLIVRYAEGPKSLGIMGLFSATGRIRPSEAEGIKSWLGRARSSLDQGKDVYVSLNHHSEPIFMRALKGGDFDSETLSSHDFPWGTWKTVKVSKKNMAKSEDFEKGAKGDWQKEGYTIHYTTPKTRRAFATKIGSPLVEDGAVNGDHTIWAVSPSGKKVGHLDIDNHQDNSMFALETEVDEDHQRKGLASAMYRLAEEKTGRKFSPSPHQTDEGAAIWNQPNRPFGKSEDFEKAREPEPDFDVGAVSTSSDTEKKPKASELNITVKGKPVAPNLDIKNAVKSEFDHKNGILHTPRGSFQLRFPEKGDKKYKKILNSPEIQEVHRRAMKNWFRLNEVVRNGGHLPDEVVAHANLFSILSANTPVPQTELLYSRLKDVMGQQGLDPRTKKFGEAFLPGGEGREGWRASDSPTEMPEHSREYWEGRAKPTITQMRASKGTGRQAGDIVKLGSLDAFSDRIQKYPQAHRYIADLVAQHGGDTQKIVSQMMADRSNGKLPDDHPMQIGVGLGSKTSRFAVSMMGGGQSVVPDTHFVRHIFGLDSNTDSDTIHYLKNVLWKYKNHHILNSLDQFYRENHPAVDFVKNAYFGGKDDPHSVFPAFWLHWLGISPHEREQGIGKPEGAKNISDHTPYFDTANEILDRHGLGNIITKSEDEERPLVHRTASAVHEIAEKLGTSFASMIYYSHIVPKLLGETTEDHHTHAIDVNKAKKVLKLAKSLLMEKIGQMTHNTQPLSVGHDVFQKELESIMGGFSVDNGGLRSMNDKKKSEDRSNSLSQVPKKHRKKFEKAMDEAKKKDSVYGRLVMLKSKIKDKK